MRRFGGLLGLTLTLCTAHHADTAEATTIAPGAVQAPRPGVILVESQQTAASIYKNNISRVFTVHGDLLGTGFVFRSDQVVTNAHVVGDATTAEIEAQDGSQFPANVVFKDVEHDFAILEFAGGIRPFATLMPLTTADTPNIGDGLVIIGSPGGSKGTVTSGIVSQVYSNGMIQLNASVNSGNSGGPVFDMQGRVFGIATLKIVEFVDGQSVDGLAIAIPIGWLSGH